ncbi:hypothetical protein EWS90_28305 [Pseudomonas aeruginosa]|uniref:hypothetical protein n=1 Tax=Pseudomonas aeruginosa TaxID=287 RepID=UPI00101AF05F|nr:hypothetical protein [Pseudomonas aeruginosa]QBC10358.1 hypothetical protein EWS90_28305 [Pseudomonas aeruginosa]
MKSPLKESKEMRAIILILAALSSSASMANSYCESRGTARAVFQCYEAISQMEVAKMKGLYEKMQNHPASTQESLQQLEFDHQNWAGLMDASCRDSRCAYTALVNRNNSLIARLNALGPVQTDSPTAENCLDAWITAYRKEVGEEAPIINDQINEWEDWCASGKYP